MGKKATKKKPHAKSKSNRSSAPKPKQQTLPAPGMARDVPTAVADAAELYADAKIAHRASTEEVTQAQKNLLAAMKEHNIPRCIVDVAGEEHVVEVEAEERAKMRKYDAEKEARKAAKMNGASNGAAEASP